MQIGTRCEYLVDVRTRGVAATVLTAMLAAFGFADGGQAAADEPAPCNAADEPHLALVAPDAIPVSYTSGFYVQYTGAGAVERLPYVTLEPASPGGVLRQEYRDKPYYSSYDDRMRLRFHPGDGPARISARYVEKRPDASLCNRTLQAVVRPRPAARPKIRLNYSVRRQHIYVRGKIRRGLPRPVLVRVFEGSLRFYRKQRLLHPHRGRFAVSFRLSEYYDYRGQDLPFFARAYYPGNVRETWPWDHIEGNSWTDRCMRIRMNHPPGTRPSCG